MTPSNLAADERIRETLWRLRILRNAPDDVSEWERLLAHVPADVLDAAVALALKTRVYFPLPAELLVDADAAAFYLRAPSMTPPSEAAPIDRDRERALPAPVTVTIPIPNAPPIELAIKREWRYECTDCDDSGWIEHWCGPYGDDAPTRPPNSTHVACNRHGEHGAHAWVSRCPCIPTNHTIARRLDRQRPKYSQERNTV